MRQRLIINVIIVIVLLGVAAYLSYQVALAFIQGQAVTDLRDRVFNAETYPPPAADVEPLIDEVESKLELLGGDELRLMHMELLLLRASYYPEQSVADLRQAISLGQDFYALPNIREDVLAPELARIYLFACLPAKLERWQAEALTVAPQHRAMIRLLQVYGRILGDDPASAHSLIERELATRGELPDTKLLALCGYAALDDMEAADAVAPDTAVRDTMPLLLRYAYADYLLRGGLFAAAEAQLRTAMDLPSDNWDSADVDPDDALLLATVIAGQRGLDDPQALQLLERAAQSTRYPHSRAGAAAVAANTLFWVTEAQVWWEALQGLAELHPDDVGVLLALADAGLMRLKRAAASDVGWEPAGPLPLAEAALDLATTEYQRQAAHILMARALAHPLVAFDKPADALAESARHLRAALGDPQLPQGVASERVPDYELFLLDANVRAAREGEPAYDQAVHRAVIDYLNRRQELFAEVVKLEPLSYEWSPGQ